MRGKLKIELEKLEYGPATASLRLLLAEWAAIDWFVPSRITRDAAKQLFNVHRSLGVAYLPEELTQPVQLTCIDGGWREFCALCKLVRANPSWDWKYAVLKTMAHAHAQAHGWELKARGPALQKVEQSTSELFFRYGEIMIWNSQLPELELRGLSAEQSESASFYLSYCHMELIESLEWQLAEGHSDISGNPFVPLLRSYAAGVYPFFQNTTSVVLFSFAAPK